MVGGLMPVLLDELAGAGWPDVSAETSATSVRVSASRLDDVRRLRTARDAWLVLHFPIPRPKALLGESQLRDLTSSITLLARAYEGFRLSAAGSGSAVFTRLAEELSARTGLAHRPEDGELVIRVRRAPDGWEVLLRLGPRPQSARPWRVPGFPGALDASVAAAMVRLALDGRRGDLADLCCGSGAILAEAAAASGADRLVGIDWEEGALFAARRNLEGADPRRLAQLVRADVGALPLPDRSLDAACANPPWGHQFGRHSESDTLHARLLAESARVVRPGGRLVVLTHEIRRFEAALAEQGGWRESGRLQVDLRGVHPCLWVLDRSN